MFVRFPQSAHRGLWPALLLILGVLLAQVFAADFSKNHDPEGALRVRLDYGLATTWPPGKNLENDKTKNRPFLYSSLLVFNDEVKSITDEELWRITFDAHREMVENHKKYGANARFMPGIMTVLTVKNEIYISSSVKGASFTYDYRETPVLETLRTCSAIWMETTGTEDETQHRNKGHCGEIMAAHQYYIVHPEQDQRLSTTGGRTAAVRTVYNDLENPVAYPPCGTEDRDKDMWGCRLFLDAQKLTDINLEKANSMPDRVELDKIAGGIKEIKQIPACSGGEDNGEGPARKKRWIGQNSY